MGKAGRVRFERCYEARRMAEEIEAVYRRAITLPIERPAPSASVPVPRHPDADLVELLACPRCHQPLRTVTSTASADGRIKDGQMVCDRCGMVVADVHDFRFDFRDADRALAPQRSDPLVVPVLGELRLAPIAKGFATEGGWRWGAPYLATDGLLGDRLTFSARGTDITVRMGRTPSSGRVAISVDGEVRRVVDLFDPDGSLTVGVDVLANAPDALHQVELLALGASPRAGEHAAGRVLVEEVVVKGPITPGRPFAPPEPINRGNPYSPALEALLAQLPAGSPVLEIGGGDRRRATAGHINFEYLPFELADMYGDALHLPFRDGAFELVCSQAVFEHVRRPFDAASELVRVTRPGGLIFTEVAFLQPVHAVPHHYFNMTTAGVRELFPGCEVVDEGWFGPPSVTVEWMLRAAGLEGKVPRRKLDRIVSGLRELDALVTHDDLQAVASGVHVTVRTPER
jgi:hypothetical protein